MIKRFTESLTLCMRNKKIFTANAMHCNMYMFTSKFNGLMKSGIGKKGSDEKVEYDWIMKENKAKNKNTRM